MTTITNPETEGEGDADDGQPTTGTDNVETDEPADHVDPDTDTDTDTDTETPDPDGDDVDSDADETTNHLDTEHDDPDTDETTDHLDTEHDDTDTDQTTDQVDTDEDDTDEDDSDTDETTDHLDTEHDDPDTDETTDQVDTDEDDTETEQDDGPLPEADIDRVEGGGVDGEGPTGGESPEPAAATPANHAPVPPLAGDSFGPEWTLPQLLSILFRVVVVCLAIGLAGFGLGTTRGGVHIARSEFVYSLDESVPDSFLREDRRLLTQVATFTSDAVTVPVAERFGLDPDDLRDKMTIETVELSEVLRLEVTDPDAGRAIGLNRALVDGYLQALSDAAPIDDGRELVDRRDELLVDLQAADQRQLALEQLAQRDALLDVEQESIQRRVDLTQARVDGLQGRLDDALVQILSAARRANLVAELEAAEAELTDLESQLASVAAERAELATASTTRPDLTREIGRLEAQLATIEAELTDRELGPLLGTPILELSEPVLTQRTAAEAGLRGAAIGALVALPLAAWLAYRARRRQLWLA